MFASVKSRVGSVSHHRGFRFAGGWIPVGDCLDYFRRAEKASEFAIQSDRGNRSKRQCWKPAWTLLIQVLKLESLAFQITVCFFLLRERFLPQSNRMQKQSNLSRSGHFAFIGVYRLNVSPAIWRRLFLHSSISSLMELPPKLNISTITASSADFCFLHWTCAQWWKFLKAFDAARKNEIVMLTG